MDKNLKIAIHEMGHAIAFAMQGIATHHVAIGATCAACDFKSSDCGDETGGHFEPNRTSPIGLGDMVFGLLGGIVATELFNPTWEQEWTFISSILETKVCGAGYDDLVNIGTMAEAAGKPWAEIQESVQRMYGQLLYEMKGHEGCLMMHAERVADHGILYGHLGVNDELLWLPGPKLPDWSSNVG
jgi:hypothetical protein